MKKLLKLNLLLLLFLFAGILQVSNNVYAKTVNIGTASELKKLKDARPGDRYVLKNDIDLKKVKDWKPFDFNGILDGKGYAVKNLKSTTGGLFDNLSSDAQISNLRLVNINIYNLTSFQTGGLANTSDGSSIKKCAISGYMSSIGISGGFIGKAENTNISSCVSSMAFDTGSITGGIVGEGRGNMSITNCLMIGNISKDSSAAVGGIAGEFSGVLKGCVTASGVLDTESSSNNKGSIVGIAKNTANISDCYFYGNVAGLAPDNKEYKSVVHLDEKANKSIITGLNFKIWTLRKNVNNGIPILKWYIKYINK